MKSAQETDPKAKSALEALVNSFGSYPIGYAVGIMVLPLSLNWLQEDLFTANLVVTLLFAITSFVRVYLLRRLFSRLGFDGNFIKLGKKLYQKIK